MRATVLRFSEPPPSTNALFINRRSGGRARSKAYDAWRNQAGWEINAQRPRPITGPVALEYEIQDGFKLDLGNAEKGLSDILVTHRLIEDDNPSIVRSITLRWSDLITGVRVTITPAVVVPF